MSDTNRGRMAYVRQTIEGELPSTPAWQLLRFNTSSLGYEKQTTESNELNSEGMTTDLPETGARSAGSFAFEWSAQTYDDFIEAATRGTWGHEIAFTGEFTLAAVARTLTAASGTPFANARVGQFVLISGCTAGESYSGALDSPNNGWYEIETVTSDTVLVLKDPGTRLIDETVTAGNGALRSKCLINGQVKRMFAFEESFLDVQSFLLFLDQYINTMSMSLSANSITTGDVEVMGSDVRDEQAAINHSGAITVVAATRTITATGAFADAVAGQRITITGMVESGNNGEHVIDTVTDDDNVILTVASASLVDEPLASGGEIVASGATWSATATYVSPNDEAVLNSTSNVGQILIDGEVSSACFRSLNLNITNNLRETGCIGRKFPRIGYGRQGVTGSFEKLFANLDLWRAMKQHADLSMSFGAINPQRTHGIHVMVPRLKIASDTVDLSGGNDSDVVDNVNWTALRYADATLGENYHLQICVA